jgi:hypothetical protein
MQKGKNYLVGLNLAPTFEPKQGSWAHVRYQNGHREANVTPVLTTESWVGVTVVHIFALTNDPDPVLNDQLLYWGANGNGESRTITSSYLSITSKGCRSPRPRCGVSAPLTLSRRRTDRSDRARRQARMGRGPTVARPSPFCC